VVPYDDIETLKERSAQDLLVAELIVNTNDELLEHIGFNLQQFIEKKMKVCLQERNIDYPKTHDLVLLLRSFPQGRITDDDKSFAHILSRFAVESRYGKRSVPPMDGRQLLERTKRFAEMIETLWEDV